MTTLTLNAPPRGRRRGAALGQSPRQQRYLTALALLGVPAGAGMIVFAFHHAAGLAEPDDLQFALYWVGFLLGMLPLVTFACARHVSAVTRAGALIAVGLFGMLPRLQRFGPAGSDEFIHLRQALEALLSGDVGHLLYLLPISKEFFGLHQAASATARLTALPLWLAAMAVVIAAHALSVLAIYQLIRAVDVSARGAGVGAVIYTLNPSWLYFNATFSYESLSLPLVLWCLAAAVMSGRPTSRPDLRAVAAGVFCVIALPMIHHLATIMLIAILTLLLIARLVHWYPHTLTNGVGASRERLWPMAVIWFALLGSVHFWWSKKYDWLLAYLSPAWTEGLAQLGKILNGIKSSSGQRSLFGDSPNPAYEIIAGYAYPFVTAAIFTVAMAVLWNRRRTVGTAVWGFAVVGAMFFASMPMLLTNGGAEGAHRSWGYSFIGIAVVCGVAWGHRLPPAVAQHRWIRAPWHRFSRPAVRTVAVGVVFTVLAMGSATLGVNLSARFPGTANIGDDARSISKEGAAVSAWMAANAPVDTPVMADRYVSLQVGSFGRMSALRPSEAFPLWDLYMNAAPVRPEVLKMLWDSKIRFLVVDSRMATTRPKLGYWFTRNEPGARGDTPFPRGALNRFDCLPWLQAVFAAGPLTVYQVDRDALRRTAAGSCKAGVG